MKTNKYIILLTQIILILSEITYSQNYNNYIQCPQKNTINHIFYNCFYKDTTQKVEKTKNVSISGIFAGIGTGLSIPIAEFHAKSNPVFGILGRVEYSSTAIFPFVIGGELSYFSYSGSDNYMTQNLLTTYQTKIFSAGLTADITLSRFLKSYYTIPFVCIDVKTNSISRQISSNGGSLPNVPLKETRISLGAGIGFTLYALDFYIKYNYMKDLSSFGIFTKIKFPVFRF